MTVVRCVGCRKYYDSDKYDVCPHCGEPPASDEEKRRKKKKEAETSQKRNDAREAFDEDDKETEMRPIDEEGAEETAEILQIDSFETAGGHKTSNDDDKTLGWFEMKTGGNDNIAKNDRKNSTPVVGWLVCVKGCHFGESFSIYVGRNTVGRNPGNRIVIPLDGAVSREKHIWITYDPKKRKFSVQPGDGANIAYVNASSILESIELKKNDILEIGESQFILIPLCDDNFSWENYINGEQSNE